MDLRGLYGLPPAGTRIDTRTQAGKRLKPLLVAAAADLRGQGHTVKAISEAIGVSAATVSGYLFEAGGMALVSASNSTGHDPRRAIKTVTAEREADLASHNAAVKSFRREYRRARKQGKPPPWRLAPPERSRSEQEQVELDALVKEQERQLARSHFGLAERPYGSQSLYTGHKGVVRLDAMQWDRRDGHECIDIENIEDDGEWAC